MGSFILISTRRPSGGSEPRNQRELLCQLSTRSRVPAWPPSQPKPSLLCRGRLFVPHFPSGEGCLWSAHQTQQDPEQRSNRHRDSELFPVLGSGAPSLRCPWAGPSGPTRKAGARVSVCSGDHPHPHPESSTLSLSPVPGLGWEEIPSGHPLRDPASWADVQGGSPDPCALAAPRSCEVFSGRAGAPGKKVTSHVAAGLGAAASWCA